DASGLLLVGTNAGLYAGLPSTRPPRDASTDEAASESKPGEPKPPAADAAAKQTAGNTGDTKRTADTPPAAAEPKPADETETKAADGAKKAEGDEAKKPAPEASKRASEPALVGNVRAVATFDGATYIASFGRGLERLDRAEGRPRRALVWPSPDDDPRLREVVSLHADSSGRRLWLGTASAGVFFYDGREVRTEPALDPLRGAAVRSISGGAGAPLWLATGRGLYLYRDGALTEAVRGLDARAVIALPHEPTTNVTAAAWCATAGGGLLRVAVDELFGVIVARLDVEQGLPSQSAFALLPLSEDGGDALWVGTARGASRYEPGRVAPTLRASRVTGARAHQPEELKSGLRLEYPQNSLVVDVEATSSRTFPEQFQYAFLLYDGKGEIIKRKLAHDSQFQLENLPPGDYRVEARAYTVDLTPSPPLSFALRVPRAPFPWTTAALSVLLGLAFVALAWGAVQNARERRAGRALLDANRKLADARLQLANETEAERRRIARDLHDQTLADLRRLLLLTDQLPAAPNGSNGHDETLDPAALRSEIESISGEVRRICEDLSPSVLENVGFAAALEFALAHAIAHLPADCRFTYEFVCDDDIEERLRFSRGVQLQIYRIVQEAVSNVCRHAGATHVRLRVDVNEAGEFVLTLEDDGRGFDHDNRSARRGRGLSNIRARASIIEAAVRWHKRDARGTVFMLRKGAGENGGTSKSQ
ncbi:MAG TPA: ATP-binding protein, partial [Pyrinomonadaceae bacterium]|nr:ATP-binding protein [Pyrinomonadaceae bacterium]